MSETHSSRGGRGGGELSRQDMDRLLEEIYNTPQTHGMLQCMPHELGFSYTPDLLRSTESIKSATERRVHFKTMARKLRAHERHGEEYVDNLEVYRRPLARLAFRTHIASLAFDMGPLWAYPHVVEATLQAGELQLTSHHSALARLTEKLRVIVAHEIHTNGIDALPPIE